MNIVFKEAYIIAGFATMLAFIIQGCAGFGGTVISSPINAGLLGPTMGPFNTVVGQPTNLWLVIKDFKKVDWKSFGLIAALSIPGVIVGNVLAPYVIESATLTKFLIGCFVTVVAIMGIIKVFGKAKVESEVQEGEPTLLVKIYRWACLFLGAVFQGLFAIGGPLVTVYTLSVVKDKSKFRATMSAIWLLLNGITMISLTIAGTWPEDILSAFIFMWPLAIIGFKIGTILHDKVNQQLFLKIVYVILLGVGVSQVQGVLPSIIEMIK